MKRNQWTAVFFAFLLFACGIAIGALGQRYYSSTVVMAKSPEDFRQHYLSEMRSRLDLTSKQVDQLDSILDETKAKAKAVRDQYHPAIAKIKEDQVAQVKSILTPAQIPAYEQLVADREHHAREQEEHDRQQDQKRVAKHHQQASQ